MPELSITGSTEKRLGTMNEAQRQAVLHREGPLLLLAGPGSGKTFTITNRILYLLEQGVAPEAILVITFTKEAALSMQNRFQEMSCADSMKFYPVNFGTFHSVFYHILKESHVLKSNALLKASEKKNLLFPILKNYADPQQTEGGQEDNFYQLNEDVAQILSAISFYKNTMELARAGSKVPARWQPYFEAICRDYEHAVRKTCRIDFDDMLYGCMNLLREKAETRSYWQGRFRHILIDEFQDINPVQYEVVKLLAAEPYNLFAVGDDDQAIYGFRGSEPDCLRRFAADFRARQLLLDVNYRSTPEIVGASLAVIGENKNRFEKQLRAAGAPESPVVSFACPEIHKEAEEMTASRGIGKEAETVAAGNGICRNAESIADGFRSRKGAEAKPAWDGKDMVAIRAFKDSEEEYEYMLQSLKEQLRMKGSFAVLFRTNSYMQGFAARLRASDIPYEMREKVSSIYEHFIVADIMAYIQVAQGEGKREQMLRIMNRPSRYISREAVGKGNVDIGKMRKYYDLAPLPESQKTSVKNALYRLEKQLQSIRKLSPLPAVSYILKAVGYEQYLKGICGSRPEKWLEWKELLEWLKEDAARFAGYKEWLSFQEEYTKALERGERPESVPSETGLRTGRTTEDAAQVNMPERNAVQLMTVHGSKGLEFDKVWIPDCNERIFPHGRMPDEKSVEEERRIFYVAMTRARKSLELLYLTGTKERPRQPSRFLNPLLEKRL